MRRWIALVGVFVLLTAVGGWLWFRQGADVWLDAVIAFCT